MQTILSLIETLALDLRYALRTLRRDGALTTFAILIPGCRRSSSERWSNS